MDRLRSMSLEMQEQLLKACEEQSFYPVGSNKLVKSNFRIICATLDDLQALVKAGKFRIDLYQRIAGYTFTQPSLRTRKEDIFPILKNALRNSRKIVIKDEIKFEIENYKWPGNIRELLRFADVLSVSNSGILTLEEFNDFTKNSCEASERSKYVLTESQLERAIEIGFKEFIDEISREIIAFSLLNNENQVRKAIAQLGISSQTFYKYKTSDAISKVKTPISTEELQYEIQ